jgi:23S rRNA pseudouridine2605 synthase
MSRRASPRSTRSRKKPGPAKPHAPVAETGPQRLQKVLAAAGIGSRRKCEELIQEGRVEVDRKVITELGTRVDPLEHEIRVDGSALARPKLLHYVVYKPVNVVSTNYDPSGRPRVIDLVPDGHRLFTIGRLDLSSEGLILVTNDGELTNLLAHPRYGVEKTYHVLVAGEADRDVLTKLRKGVHLAEGYAHALRASIKSRHKQSTLLEIVLDEGRNREIRRLLARLGHKVLRLKRVALGPLRLADMKPGEVRPLRRDELEKLRKAALTKKDKGRRMKDEPAG